MKLEAFVLCCNAGCSEWAGRKRRMNNVLKIVANIDNCSKCTKQPRLPRHWYNKRLGGPSRVLKNKIKGKLKKGRSQNNCSTQGGTSVCKQMWSWREVLRARDGEETGSFNTSLRTQWHDYDDELLLLLCYCNLYIKSSCRCMFPLYWSMFSFKIEEKTCTAYRLLYMCTF